MPVTSTEDFILESLRSRIPNHDAFARLRTSTPHTIFDSKQIFDDPDIANTAENYPYYYDNQETAGGGTGSTFNVDRASTKLTVSATTTGTRIRQTKQRFNYQPGKSMLVLLTFVLGTAGTGITKCIGYFDENNGLFLQQIGTANSFVRRTKVTGSVANNTIAQADWNIDTMDGSGDAGNPTGITIDFTKAQILFIDFEWLSVGTVRYGFFIGGTPCLCHREDNSNTLASAYMSTPNLPVRVEIANDGTGAANDIEQICVSISSEGGVEPAGLVHAIDTGSTHIDANTANSIYAVIGLKLKAGYLGATVVPIDVSMVSETNDDFRWSLCLNPTIAGTFTYANVANSALQAAKGTTINTISDEGELIASGYASVDSQEISLSFNDAEHLGSLIDGTSDVMALAVMPLSANADIQASLIVRELI